MYSIILKGLITLHYTVLQKVFRFRFWFNFFHNNQLNNKNKLSRLAFLEVVQRLHRFFSTTARVSNNRF